MLSLGARPWLATAGLLALSIAAPCQQSTHAVSRTEQNASRLPQFDVAAIRPGYSNDLVRSFWFTQDGVSIKGIPLDGILKSAFPGLHEYGEDRIISEPRWVKSDLYDIQAKVGESDVPRWKKLPVSQQQLALRALIEERFQLRFHRMSRISSVYVLSLDRGGPRLKSADHLPHMFDPQEPGHLQSHSTFMWQLVQALEDQLNSMVLDETGLTGNYDYTLEWRPDDAMHADSSGPSLFTALKEQIGLKLEMQKRPVDVVVIDHIEKPSQN
jgi:uncharacterized protein (TIGR03435 family)